MADRKIYIEVEFDDKGAKAKFVDLDKAVERVGNTSDTKVTPAMTRLQLALERATGSGGRMFAMITGGVAAGQILAGVIGRLATGIFSLARDAFSTAIDQSIKTTNAMLGLSSVARAFGVDADAAKKAAKSLAADGLMTVGQAAEGLKNLLGTRFNLDQATNLMLAFKDAAAFGRQGTLAFGESIVGATQGLKNQLSMMVDNVGVTKNLSNILVEAGFKASDLSKVQSDAKVRLALYNGILKETIAFTGDASRVSQTYQGNLTRLQTVYNNLLGTWGAAITENKTVGEAMRFVTDMLQDMTTSLSDNGAAFLFVSDAVIQIVKALAGFLRGLDLVQVGAHAVKIVIQELAGGFINLAAMTLRALLAFDRWTQFTNPAAWLPARRQAMEDTARFVENLEKAYNSLSEATNSDLERQARWGNALQSGAIKLDALAVSLEATRGKTMEYGNAGRTVTDTQNQQTDSTQKLLEKTKELEKELTAAKGFMTQSQLIAEFGSKVKQAIIDLQIAGAAIPPIFLEIAAAMDKLEIEKLNRDLVKGAATWKEFTAELEVQTKRIGEAIIANALRVRDIERTMSDEAMQQSMSEANFKILQLRRVAQAEIALAMLGHKDDPAGTERRIMAIAEQAFVAEQALIAADEAAQKFLFQNTATSGKKNETGEQIRANLKGLLTDLPDLFSQAFTGGGGVGGAFAAIGMQIADAIAKPLLKATEAIKNAFKAVSAGAAAAAAVGGAAAGQWGAAIGSTVSTIGGAALATTAFGKAMASTTLGAVGLSAATAGIGLAGVGVFMLAKHFFGVSEAVKKAREESEKYQDQLIGTLGFTQRLEAGNERWKGTLIAVRDAYLATGRSAAEAEAVVQKLWDTDNPKRVAEAMAEIQKVLSQVPPHVEAWRNLLDVFVMLEKKEIDVATAGRLIDDVWGEAFEHGVDAAGHWVEGLKEVVQMAREAGIESKAITEALKNQASTAIAGSNAIVGALDEQFKKWHDLGEKVRELSRSGGDQDALTRALEDQADAAEGAKQELADLGVIAVGTFNAALNAGLSFNEALAASQPALQKISQAYKDLGINIEDTGLKSLVMQSDLLTRIPSVINGVTGLTQSFIALGNMNDQNVDTFRAMERTGINMFRRIQGEVAQLGGDQRAALMPMQDYLHEAEKRAKDLGVALDPVTAEMIAQSKELGIWQDKGPTVFEEMRNGINDMVEAIKALIRQLKGIPDEIPDPTRNWDIDRRLPDQGTGTQPFPGPGDIQHTTAAANQAAAAWSETAAQVGATEDALNSLATTAATRAAPAVDLATTALSSLPSSVTTTLAVDIEGNPDRVIAGLQGQVEGFQSTLQAVRANATSLGTPLDANTQLIAESSEALDQWKISGPRGADATTQAIHDTGDAVLDLIRRIRSIPDEVPDPTRNWVLDRRLPDTGPGVFVPPEFSPFSASILTPRNGLMPVFGGGSALSGAGVGPGTGGPITSPGGPGGKTTNNVAVVVVTGESVDTGTKIKVMDIIRTEFPGQFDRDENGLQTTVIDAVAKALNGVPSGKGSA